MTKKEDLEQIRDFVLTKEIERQKKIVENPHSFLEELAGLVQEPSNDVLQSTLGNEFHLKRIWSGIFLLASEFREKEELRWRWKQQCEPVVRNFLNRISPLVFPENSPFSQLLKEAYYKSIFGEEEVE